MCFSSTEPNFSIDIEDGKVFSSSDKIKEVMNRRCGACEIKYEGMFGAQTGDGWGIHSYTCFPFHSQKCL